MRLLSSTSFRKLFSNILVVSVESSSPGRNQLYSSSRTTNIAAMEKNNTKSKRSTTDILHRLRALMKDEKLYDGDDGRKKSIDAYIVPSGDAHQSEYIAACDKRRQYVSNFSGSRGLACVTEKSAALWTDGRYFLQAERELDENWTLMKEGLPNTPNLVDWLTKQLPSGGRVGVDPYLVTPKEFNEWSRGLQANGLSLTSKIKRNLVDLVWSKEQPKRPTGQLTALDLSFAGKSWQEKIDDIRRQMKEQQTVALVLSALDEVAWTFNLRGSDIPYCPVFFAYAIVGMDFINLFVDESKITTAIREHLNASNGHKVEILPYDSMLDHLKKYRDTHADGRFWSSGSGTSLAIAEVIPESRLCDRASPVLLAKALKNPVEMNGMKNCHIKDALAHVEFLHWLENEMQKRDNMTENDVATKFEELRSRQDDFVGLSFETISAAGANSAKPHYKAPGMDEPQTKLSKDRLYLVDSGGQYRDGTTDVTRTVCFTEPTSYQKECFTLVLKGHIAMALMKFPDNMSGYRLDSVSRMALWNNGLDYRHGTGHGVGHFLNVHEGPAGFSIRPDSYTDGVREHMVITIEPGYYEDGEFGIRIENCYAIVEAQTKYKFQNTKYLTFESLTWVPIQKRLIDPNLLTKPEIDWLNQYHKTVYEKLAPHLEKKGRMDLVQWLQEQTAPLTLTK